MQVAGEQGITHSVPDEYWKRLKNAFATDANEFVDGALENKLVPVILGLGIKGLTIGRALQDSLLTDERSQFSEKG